MQNIFPRFTASPVYYVHSYSFSFITTPSFLSFLSPPPSETWAYIFSLPRQAQYTNYEKLFSNSSLKGTPSSTLPCFPHQPHYSLDPSLLLHHLSLILSESFPIYPLYYTIYLYPNSFYTFKFFIQNFLL